MSDDSRDKLKTAKDMLGRRRFRIALAYYGKHQTPRQIAGRLRISKWTVERELARIMSDAARLRSSRTPALGGNHRLHDDSQVFICSACRN